MASDPSGAIGPGVVRRCGSRDPADVITRKLLHPAAGHILYISLCASASCGITRRARKPAFATRNKLKGCLPPFPLRSGDVSSWEVPIYVGLTIATLRYVAILRSLVHLADHCGHVRTWANVANPGPVVTPYRLGSHMSRKLSISTC
jgi:hypothetical protein